MEPSVGKGFKCSQCPPSDIMRGCMVVFGVRNRWLSTQPVGQFHIVRRQINIRLEGK